MLEKIFKLKENNTCVKTEFIAGLITFSTMVYILVVNASMYTNPFGTGENVFGLSYGAIYVATALSATIGCFLMGFLANLPIVLACGMGLNAFFIYTVCLSLGFSYENALVTIFAEGLIFLLLVLTGGLRKIYESMPECVRCSIPAGIGLFLTLLGLKNAGIIINDATLGISLNSFNLMHTSFSNIMPAVITLLTLFIMTVFLKKNVKGAVLWGIILGTVLYYILGSFMHANAVASIVAFNPIVTCKEYFTEVFGQVFICGFDFSPYIAKHGIVNFVLTFTTTTIAFCLVNIFDNIGSLQAICTQGNLLDKDGKIPKFNRAMLANSMTATLGSILGISTVTTYVESATGIAEGGRTGLTAIFMGLLFIVMIFLSPLCQLVPNCATAAALIYVGTVMMSTIKNMDWSDVGYAIPAFLTMCMMPFTCNISNGIAFGLIAYVLINLFEGKFKEIKLTTWLIVLLFIATLLLSH